MKIAILMGSKSDWPILSEAADVLTEFEIQFEKKVLSAHRTPQEMLDFAKAADAAGFSVLIAGAGGAAHLPGMLASQTNLPVIGVPVKLKALDGMDSLLSIVQMPKGVPVATVAIDNAQNAALLAIRILALQDVSLKKKLITYQQKMADLSRKMNDEI